MKLLLLRKYWSRFINTMSDKSGGIWLGSERKKDPCERFFPLPNCIFSLGLESGEILVYAYLMYCEDRKTFKCYPSFNTIGEAVGMSKNTVIKYVRGLKEKRLIETERTTVRRKSDNKARNGNLLYYILPIQNAIDYYDNYQNRILLKQAAAENAKLALAKYDRKHGKNDTDSSV